VRHELDPEVAAALSLVRLGAAGPARVAGRGDWRTLRETGNAGQAYMSAITPASQGVTRTSYLAQAQDGARIELRWYQRRDERPGPAVIYAHGGGMVLGREGTGLPQNRRARRSPKTSIPRSRGCGSTPESSALPATASP
jgi:acetyl esterase/lipase